MSNDASLYASGISFSILSAQLFSKKKFFQSIQTQIKLLLQHGLVGIIMTVFYLVLLSLAEHTGFITAFTAASVITVLMNSLYIAAAQKSWIKGIIMAILFSGLYTRL